MPRVDFILSNPGHHVATFEPVIRRLLERPGYVCRVLSLCELRGMRSPEQALRPLGVELWRLFPRHVRRSPELGRRAGGSGSLSRRLAHRAIWHLFLGRALRRALRRRPDLVALPNDSAFPYDRICRTLRRRRIPFLLVQEGVRFDPPSGSDPGRHRQGRGGAAALALWGRGSAAYFLASGVPEERIALTGSPRFDVIADTDWAPAAAELSSSLGPGERKLVFLSNPIDDLGFCTGGEKLDLFRGLVERLTPLFDDPRTRLIVKLHGRESPEEFETVCRSFTFADRLVVRRDVPLYPLLATARAAMTFGSSAGLEALLFGLPLAVLEVPGAGYLHDFVASGAAIGLPAEGEIAGAVAELLERWEPGEAAERYLEEALAVRSGASERVADLIARHAESTTASGAPGEGQDPSTPESKRPAAVPAGAGGRRILVFRSELSQGGADRVALVLLRELAARGFSPELVLMRRRGDWLDEVPEGVPVHDLDRPSLWRITLPLAGLLRRRRPDYFLCLDGGGNVPAVLAHRLAGRPGRLVLSERNILHIGGRTARRLLQVALKRLLYRFADHVAAVSSGVKEDLVRELRLDPRGITVVYNPLVDERLDELAAEPVDHPWFEEDTPVLLAAGRLVPQKDHATLLEGFALLRRRMPARLFVLGDGPERSRLQAMATALGCDQDVHFAGFDRNPFRYMARCDLFLLTSRNEGLPGVLIQAMACGAAAIATDCRAGPAEVISRPGRDGILIPVGDPRALADRAEDLLRRTESRASMGRAARESAQRFRVERSVDLYLAALDHEPRSSTLSP